MGNLNKVVYTDHQTVITASNLNDIQDAVVQNTSYTTCTTAANTAAKTAALTNFVLTTGSAVKVKFTNSNTAANPTLNINSTGAKSIMQYGTTVAGTTATESWDDGAVVEFVYDGTNWIIQGRNLNKCVNTDAQTLTSAQRVQAKANIGFTTSWIVDDDLNNYIETGVYWFRGASNSPLGSSSTQVWAILEVSGRSDTCEQIFYANDHTIWSRGFRSSAWSDWVQVMRSTGGTFNGEVIIDRQDGTASTEGWSGLTVGNSIAKGTSKNSTGYVRIFGKTGYRTDLNHQSDGMPTANRALYLPDATGTIALTSDIYNATNISNYFTLTASGVSLNGANVCLKVGATIILRLNFVKTDSGNFAQSRYTMGTLSTGVRPITARYVIGAASNGINSYLNRQCGIAIQTDGQVIVDNYFHSDVKQIYINIEYTCA